MRKSFHNTKLFLENNIFYGVSLGYDYCAEHEWGHKGMKNYFGMDSSKMGIDSRKISKGEVFFKEDEDLCVLTSRKPYNLKENYTAKDILANDIRHFGNTGVECAWDERDFCIATKDKNKFPLFRELHEAFQKKNVAIAFLKNTDLNVFENSSLSLLIADKLPKQVTDSMFLVDKKAKELSEYEEKIGVAELKKKAKQNSGYKGDKYFMACSPSWIDYENAENREEQKKKMKTQYDIMFWINYSDDDDNYGWYKAEDIIKWLSTPGLKLKSMNQKKQSV